MVSKIKKKLFTQVLLKKIFWATIFAVAMGFLESAIVIYLRELYYPNGFIFPLKITFAPHIALTEIIREAATIIILISVSISLGKIFIERFAFFIYCFAIWDIFYYVFLKLILNWPESFFTWDVLFLIPAMWGGPVIAPIILSLTMILLAFCIIYFNQKSIRINKNKVLTPDIGKLWILLIIGSIILIVNFVWDYCQFIFQHYSFSEILLLPEKKFYSLSSQYMPRAFNWWVFLLGEIILLSAIILFYKKSSRIYSSDTYNLRETS